MQMLRKLLLATVAVFFSLFTVAQVTTSSISGSVKDKSGNALEGATITATHLPTGTVYNAVSKKGGIFNIPNARIGGPYKLKVEFVGQKAFEVEGFSLLLGEPYDLNVQMGEDVKQISEVVVTGGRKAAVERTGASTNISQRLLTSIPTISRSLTNFTSLTPQANGTSFAGRDNRMNNIQIDGANLNNNFGLSSDLLPGGGNQPISLDAVEEVAVNISPFDVWQGGFTGAGVNVVTKSGTNDFKGSAYYLSRSEQMNGKKIGGTTLTNLAEQTNNIYGFTLGGPIVKNKLFFFASYEREVESRPGITFTPRGGSGQGNISNTHIDSLRKLSNYLNTRFGYDPGAFDNFPNFETQNRKFLGKIDWNINKVHKLTLRYQETRGTDDRQLNGTSIPNTSTFTPVGGSAITSLPNSRFSANSMSFSNSNFFFNDNVRSGTLELNSSKSGNWANQLIATFSQISAVRGYDGVTMPGVDIFNNDGRNYMSFGTDPFSNNNQVNNDIASITNNFKLYKGKHVITMGGSYEYQRVGNMFMPGSHGHYVFNSLDDFINNRAPAFYSYLFSLVPGKEAIFSAELKVGQAAAYIQDDINVSDKLKLTLGLRADVPVYLEQPLENPNISRLAFPDADGQLVNYNNGAWPRSRMLLSPRIGFRWDVNGDKSMIVRGGTGLFTGRFPFVWLTNMPSNSFMYQQGSGITNPAILSQIRFSPNLDAHRALFNPTVGAVPNNANIVLTDPNFRFPQIWRTNIAVEKRLTNGWSVSFEGIFTKDINAIRLRNANLREPDTRLSGTDGRPAYSNRTAAGQRIYSNIATAIVLENISRGGGVVLTGQVNKALSKGFTASASYTFTGAWDVTSNSGSQATSTWQANPAVGTPNTTDLATSGFAIPHRFIAWVTYRKEYVKHLATTITLFYEARNQNNFSFLVNGDVNGDGISQDLMYIPRDRNDINLLPITGATPYSVEQQRDALEAFINNSKYLRKRRGQYAERNGALQPFTHTINLQLQQDLFTNIGNRKNTIRLQADVLNFGNMLNKNWGHRFFNTFSGNNPLQLANVTNGVPAYRMGLVSGQLPTQPFQVSRSLASTWSAQVGIRYIF